MLQRNTSDSARRDGTCCRQVGRMSSWIPLQDCKDADLDTTLNAMSSLLRRKCGCVLHSAWHVQLQDPPGLHRVAFVSAAPDVPSFRVDTASLA